MLARTDLVPGCKVFFLGTPPAAVHFREYADPLVKNALPRGHAAVSCFIQAEHAPWHHLVGAREVSPAPLETILVGGRPFAPLAVGNLTVHYLKVPAAGSVIRDPSAHFFAWRGDRFVDVGDDVREGRLVPVFFDNRPPQ
jgi:hypothetical protein